MQLLLSSTGSDSGRTLLVYLSPPLAWCAARERAELPVGSISVGTWPLVPAFHTQEFQFLVALHKESLSDVHPPCVDQMGPEANGAIAAPNQVGSE